MTDATITAIVVAICTALPLTLGQLANFRQSKRNEKAIVDTAAISDKKTSDLVTKTDQIHTMANSNLASVNSKLELANEKIAGLTSMVASLTAKNKEARDDLMLSKPAPSTEPALVEVVNVDPVPVSVTKK